MARLVVFVVTALLLTVLVGPSRANSAEGPIAACPDHQSDIMSPVPPQPMPGQQV